MRRRLVKVCLALLIAPLLWRFGVSTFGLSIGDLEFWWPQLYSLGFSLTPAFCAGLIFLVLRLRDHAFVRLVFEASWLRLCGKYSYCMYLAHLSFRTLFTTTYGSQGPLSIFGSQTAGQIVLFALMTVGSVSIAHLSFQYWERPFLSLKDRFDFAGKRDAAFAECGAPERIREQTLT